MEKPEQELMQLEKLNCAMDARAKQALRQNPEESPFCFTHGEPWYLMINWKKSWGNMANNIYKHVHGEKALQYWKKKEKLQRNRKNVHWEAIGKAMKNAPEQLWWFITKHLSGMCGVAKFLAIWKEKTSDECPGCGLHEDARHIWICPAEEAMDVWKECMDRMTIFGFQASPQTQY